MRNPFMSGIIFTLGVGLLLFGTVGKRLVGECYESGRAKDSPSMEKEKTMDTGMLQVIVEDDQVLVWDNNLKGSLEGWTRNVRDHLLEEYGILLPDNVTGAQDDVLNLRLIKQTFEQVSLTEL